MLPLAGNTFESNSTKSTTVLETGYSSHSSKLFLTYEDIISAANAAS